jgi:large conductance mechanosensitive channel
MGKLWQEFKTFAFKGNMIELAIAVVIGTAFAKVIDSLVKNVIMPLVDQIKYWVSSASSAASQPVMDYTTWHVGQIKIGAFLGDLVNFLIIAAVVFAVIVKLLGSIMKAASPPATAEPTTKECPLCLSVIPIKAKRCSHCTADLGSGSSATKA